MERVLRSRSDYQKTALRNLLTSLILYETIITSTSRAQKLEEYTNIFLNNVRSGSLIAKKLTHATLLDKNAILKVFEEILPRFAKTETTFVKVYRYKRRLGDAAKQSLITFTHGPKVKVPEKTKETK